MIGWILVLALPAGRGERGACAWAPRVGAAGMHMDKRCPGHLAGLQMGCTPWDSGICRIGKWGWNAWDLPRACGSTRIIAITPACRSMPVQPRARRPRGIPEIQRHALRMGCTRIAFGLQTNRGDGAANGVGRASGVAVMLVATGETAPRPAGRIADGLHSNCRSIADRYGSSAIDRCGGVAADWHEKGCAKPLLQPHPAMNGARSCRVTAKVQNG